jgi:hypothetical protein
LKPAFSLLVPTRSRVERFLGMVATAVRKAALPGMIEICAYVDQDDPQLAEYLKSSEEIGYYVGRRRPVAQAWEALVREASGQILMLCADDLVFRTQDWDALIVEEFARWPGRLAVVSPEDGTKQDKGTHWFVSREWVRAVGYMTWTGDIAGLGPFEHFGCDDVPEQIARGVGCYVWRRDVLIEHMHHKYGKAPNDSVYASKRMRGADGRTPSERDTERLRALRPEINAAIARVNAAIAAHKEEQGACES